MFVCERCQWLPPVSLDHSGDGGSCSPADSGPSSGERHLPDMTSHWFPIYGWAGRMGECGRSRKRVRSGAVPRRSGSEMALEHSEKEKARQGGGWRA